MAGRPIFNNAPPYRPELTGDQIQRIIMESLAQGQQSLASRIPRQNNPGMSSSPGELLDPSRLQSAAPIPPRPEFPEPMANPFPNDQFGPFDSPGLPEFLSGVRNALPSLPEVRYNPKQTDRVNIPEGSPGFSDILPEFVSDPEFWRAVQERGNAPLGDSLGPIANSVGEFARNNPWLSPGLAALFGSGQEPAELPEVQAEGASPELQDELAARMRMLAGGSGISGGAGISAGAGIPQPGQTSTTRQTFQGAPFNVPVPQQELPGSGEDAFGRILAAFDESRPEEQSGLRTGLQGALSGVMQLPETASFASTLGAAALGVDQGFDREAAAQREFLQQRAGIQADIEQMRLQRQDAIKLAGYQNTIAEAEQAMQKFQMQQPQVTPVSGGLAVTSFNPETGETSVETIRQTDLKSYLETLKLQSELAGDQKDMYIYGGEYREAGNVPLEFRPMAKLATGMVQGQLSVPVEMNGQPVQLLNLGQDMALQELVGEQADQVSEAGIAQILEQAGTDLEEFGILTAEKLVQLLATNPLYLDAASTALLHKMYQVQTGKRFQQPQPSGGQ